MTVRLVHTRDELLEHRSSRHATAVVMTMGALHDGHAELVRQARTAVGDSGHVIVTDFVNPTQFSAGEDFDRYPRTLESDVRVCEEAGADLVFAPAVEEMYGDDSVRLDPGPLGEILEGASRPGHFAGMLTIVAKLLHVTAPDLALFGEKDYQQLILITKMVADLKFPVTVVPVETVREFDGVAMSSRNRYLSENERALAAAIPQALLTAVLSAPVHGAAAAIQAGRAVLDQPGIEIDYLTIADPMLGAVQPGPGRVLTAVRIGGTRLIDNMPCEVAGP